MCVRANALYSLLPGVAASEGLFDACQHCTIGLLRFNTLNQKQQRRHRPKTPPSSLNDGGSGDGSENISGRMFVFKIMR